MSDSAPTLAPLEESDETELPSATKTLILGALTVSILAGALGTAFLPYLLLEQPILLLLSSSDGRNLLLVAPQISLPLLLLIAVPRRVLAMLITYGVARLYGQQAVAWSSRKMPSVARFITWCEKLYRRHRRAVLVFWPTYASSAIAGATRTPLRAYLPWMALGQVGYVIGSFYLGGAVSEWTDGLMDFLRRNLWQSTAVCAALVGLQQLASYLRRRHAADGSPAD